MRVDGQGRVGFVVTVPARLRTRLPKARGPVRIGEWIADAIAEALARARRKGKGNGEAD